MANINDLKALQACPGLCMALLSKHSKSQREWGRMCSFAVHMYKDVTLGLVPSFSELMKNSGDKGVV